MSEFKITSAGFYKMRNGCKAEIVGKASNGKWVGIDSDGYTSDWTTDGVFYPDIDDCVSDFDIIAPWTEPKRVKGWVNVYKDGIISFLPYKTREEADAHDLGRITCIYIDVEEGEGL